MTEAPFVENWLKKDVTRWIAGALGGAFAGLIATGFACVVSSLWGPEATFPIKVMALPLLGSGATEFGAHLPALVVGLVVIEALCAFLGFVYAHFTQTNALPSLAVMGLVWGTFSWIFIWCLFMQSFTPVLAAGIQQGYVIPICWVFGIALTSVSFFDRALRGGRTL